jgi:integrase
MMKLSEIKPLHVTKLIASKAAFSNSSQRKILNTLSQIIESSEKNGLLSHNPCKGITAGGEPAKTKEPLTDLQQIELVKAVTGTRAEVFVLLCLYAGLRREEALGLLWSDVHFGDTPYINVRRTVTFPNNGPAEYSDKLKSDSAYRSIPTPTILASALQDAKAKTSSVFVVPSVSTGSYMSLSAFRWMWEIVGRSVPFHVEPHVLRHTYLTELRASGMDIKKIQYLAGHKDVTMTLRIYTHVKMNQPAEMFATIENIFSGSDSGSKEINEA